jgi:hypothetical protein
MTLHKKVLALYPELSPTDKIDLFADGTIILQNDLDGRGEYIAAWNHATLARPTDAQIAALAGATP